MYVDWIWDNIYVYLIVDDLNNLVWGGWLINGVVLIGSLLKIKLILIFFEGKIVLFEKICLSKKVFVWVEEIIGKRNNEI